MGSNPRSISSSKIMDNQPDPLFPIADPPPPPSLRTRRVRRSFFAKDRPWLNALLFVLTAASCWFVGLSWSVGYLYTGLSGENQPFELSPDVFREPRVIALSLVYAFVLLAILLAHEMGHYLACRVYRIDATLPFFIPAPTLIGTMGAFIKIRAPITRKVQLFDIGAAGPLAGFVLALPALIFGLSLSRAVPPLPRTDSLIFGEPLLLKGLAAIFFRHQPGPFDIVVHPIAFAGWVGILVTALNLFPIGQLDGGHIFYALYGSRFRRIATWILLGFVVMGIFFWMGWLVWALLIRFMGVKHPPVQDEFKPLPPSRKFLAALLLVIFVLSFIPAPVEGYSLLEVIAQFTG